MDNDIESSKIELTISSENDKPKFKLEIIDDYNTLKDPSLTTEINISKTTKLNQTMSKKIKKAFNKVRDTLKGIKISFPEYTAIV